MISWRSSRPAGNRLGDSMGKRRTRLRRTAGRERFAGLEALEPRLLLDGSFDSSGPVPVPTDPPSSPAAIEQAASPSSSTALPYAGDFNDGTADALAEVAGNWTIDATGQTSVITAEGNGQAIPVLPSPAIVMYGHHDGAGVTDAFRDIIPPFTIIEGTSTDANFIKELRDQGRVYAAHVNNPRNETAAQLIARWLAPFDDTLGGQLPGGYDAIAIDELHGADTNGTAHSNAVVSALQQLRSLYPDKGIYVATTWHYGQNSANYTDQLNALNNHADLIMLETYIREGNPSYGWLGQHQDAYAGKINAAVPGILNKTVYGLYISQNGFVADDTTNTGYWGHLDEQFHRIRNDSNASIMPGVMFWAFYRSQKDLTPEYAAKLVGHYFVEGNTGYFGDGNTTQLISNAQFDSNTAGWTMQPGTGGTVDRFSYSSVSIQNDHDDHGQASHGSHGLQMVRGSGMNTASYQVNGIDPEMVYTASAWVMADAPGRLATLMVTDADGTVIESKQIDNAGSAPDFVDKWNEWTRIIINFVPTSGSIKLVLSDESTTPNTRLYWDFVELEEAFPAESPPPDVGAELPFSEDFGDGLANLFDPVSGAWEVNNAERYRAAPVSGENAISLVRLIDPLPVSVELKATIRAKDVNGFNKNGLLIYDFQNAGNFKFAGFFVAAGEWRIGRWINGGLDIKAQAADTIAVETDYDVEVQIRDKKATLLVGGVEKLSHEFWASVVDGDVGVGTRNAVTVFDDLVVRVTPTALPYAEDFEDGIADALSSVSGTWVINGANRYKATAASGENAVSLVELIDPLPDSVQLKATIRAKDVSGFAKNGLLIYDFQNADNFKFAGFFAAAGEWRIGRWINGGLDIKVQAADTISLETDYDVEVQLRDKKATLLVGGVEKLSHEFWASVVDGDVGVGTRNAVAVFDDLSVYKAESFPFSEKFNDGIAQFLSPVSGTWLVNGAKRYKGTPQVGEDAMSLVVLGGPVPSDVLVEATIRGKDGGSGYSANASVIFDYQGPGDFKFAGAWFGTQRWRIGHNDGTKWVTDAVLDESIAIETFYDVELVIRGKRVTLRVDGADKLDHDFADPLTGGQFGVGTRNAVSVFDDLAIKDAPTVPLTSDADEKVRASNDPEDHLLPGVLSTAWIRWPSRGRQVPTWQDPDRAMIRYPSFLPQGEFDEDAEEDFLLTLPRAWSDGEDTA